MEASGEGEGGLEELQDFGLGWAGLVRIRVVVVVVVVVMYTMKSFSWYATYSQVVRNRVD
jgi:hypothetical protein